MCSRGLTYSVEIHTSFLKDVLKPRAVRIAARAIAVRGVHVRSLVSEGHYPWNCRSVGIGASKVLFQPRQLWLHGTGACPVHLCRKGDPVNKAHIEAVVQVGTASAVHSCMCCHTREARSILAEVEVALMVACAQRGQREGK